MPALPAAAPSARSWYFAEGVADHVDRETLAFVNLGPRPAYVITTLVHQDDQHSYVVTDVPPGGRATLDAGNAFATDAVLGAVVRASEPIVAERAIYHASQASEGTAATLTTGTTTPRARWYLPRLRAAADETERLAILNPGSGAVQVRIAVAIHGALRPWRTLAVPALAVRALDLPGGVASALVSVQGVPDAAGVVVEERTFYSQDLGYTTLAGSSDLIGDGYLPLAPSGGREYLMLLNPGTRAAAVTVTALAQGKTGLLSAIAVRRLTLAPGRQRLIRLPAALQRGRQLLRLQASAPIAAGYLGFLLPSSEHSLGNHYLGSVTAPLALPARLHAFAEGDTRAMLSAPTEHLTLINVNPGPVTVQVIVIAAGGHRVQRTLILQPAAVRNIDLSTWAPPSQHGLLVLADHPILAARTIDFNQGADRLISYGAVTP